MRFDSYNDSLEENNLKLIYVAGKYSAPTYSQIEDNIRKAEQASIQLLKAGWAVITPNKNTAHYELWERFIGWDHVKWMAMSLEILKRCDAVFMLDNWKDSKGAMEEHEYAKKKGMQIFYEEEGYPTPFFGPTGQKMRGVRKSQTSDNRTNTEAYDAPDVGAWRL